MMETHIFVLVTGFLMILKVPSFCTQSCDSNNCENGGECILYTDGTIGCKCPETHNGAKCETDIRDCSSAPCLNGGLCDSRKSGYKCLCSVGFNGKNCDNSLKDPNTDVILATVIPISVTGTLIILVFLAIYIYKNSSWAMLERYNDLKRKMYRQKLKELEQKELKRKYDESLSNTHSNNQQHYGYERATFNQGSTAPIIGANGSFTTGGIFLVTPKLNNAGPYGSTVVDVNHYDATRTSKTKPVTNGITVSTPGAFAGNGFGPVVGVVPSSANVDGDIRLMTSGFTGTDSEGPHVSTIAT